MTACRRSNQRTAVGYMLVPYSNGKGLGLIHCNATLLLEIAARQRGNDCYHDALKNWPRRSVIWVEFQALSVRLLSFLGISKQFFQRGRREISCRSAKAGRKVLGWPRNSDLKEYCRSSWHL